MISELILITFYLIIIGKPCILVKHVPYLDTAAKGRRVGTFLEWSLCSDNVYKYADSVYKGYVTLDVAVHFVLANETFSNCCEIPISMEMSNIAMVSDHDHFSQNKQCA